MDCLTKTPFIDRLTMLKHHRYISEDRREGAWRVGVIGTGFVARNLIDVLRPMADLSVSRVLTRRRLDYVQGIGSDMQLTNSTAEVLANCDVIVECSGDPIHASEVVRDAMAAGLPVVTMDAEFQVTCGAYFVDKGYLTEAEGDQPGSLAALRKDVIAMGFTPEVYGNMKGFLNHNPTPEDMVYWSEHQGLRLDATTAFTDGTKVQFEQSLVANMFGADIAKTGLLSPEAEDFNTAALELADVAICHGQPLSDVVVSAGTLPGVFIVASHSAVDPAVLRYLKLGDGPHYVLVRPYHLCAMEVPKTLRAVRNGEPPLLHNSQHPRISVAAIAKRGIVAGEKVKRAIGSFAFRGEAVRTADEPDHVPIGILQNAVITRDVEPGQMLRMEDVDLPESFARDIALDLLRDCGRSPVPID